MSPTMMRRFWSLIEASGATMPLGLDDGSLVQWLLRRVRLEQTLNMDETVILRDYIHDRLPLIRDLAQTYQLC